MGIPKDKRRYNVTLTPANVDRFRGLCKDLGLPSGAMSAAIDDLLRNLSDMFQAAKDQGKFSMSDLFLLMGKQLDEIDKEEKGRAEKQERAAAPRKKRA